MNLMLDFDVLVEFLHGNSKMSDLILKAENCYVSIFDYSLLLAGANNSLNIVHNLYLVKEFIKENFEIIDFTKKEAYAFGRLKVKYKFIDMCLLYNASIALTHKFVVMSYNNEYEKIKELKTLILKDKK